MSRFNDSSALANDPNGLRKYAVDWVIDWLGDNVLNYCPDASHRIAVVSWGSTVRTDLTVTAVIAPHSFTEWASQRDGIKDKIPLLDLGETRPDLAFEEAEKILKGFAQQPLGDLPRKQAIIFISDGVPSFPDIPSDYNSTLMSEVNEDFQFDPKLLDQEKCMTEAFQIAKARGESNISSQERQNCTIEFPAYEDAFKDSTYLWTILLNNGTPYQPNFYTTLETLSIGHGGAIFNLSDNSDIPSKFLDILTRLSGISAERLGCQPFPVEPYLQQAMISFFKPAVDFDVQISYEENGQTHIITSSDLANSTSWPLEMQGFTINDHTNDNTIERFVFGHPHGGMWEIMAYPNCNGLQAVFQPLEITALQSEPGSVIPQYDLPPYYDQASPVYIEYRIVDRSMNDLPVEIDPRFPITVETTLTYPDGTTHVLNLVYDSNNKVFRSEEPLLTNIVGTYQFTTQATTPHADTRQSEPRVLFIDGPRTFSVIPVTPFQLEITEPAPNSILPLHGGLMKGFRIQPVNFRARITSRSGELIDPALVFKDPNNALAGDVTGSSNEGTSSLALYPDPSVPGEYVAQAVNLNAEGDYRLEVSIGGDQLSSQYRPDSSKADVDFKLRDPLFNRPITYKFMGIGLGFLALIGIVVVILNRTSPVTGTLVFEAGSANIADISIGSGWNVTRIRRSTLQAYPSLGLKSLRARKSKEQLGCVDYEAVDINGNRLPGTLMPDQTTGFTGGMTIRYEPVDTTLS